jgi:hypothetical protein
VYIIYTYQLDISQETHKQFYGPFPSEEAATSAASLMGFKPVPPNPALLWKTKQVLGYDVPTYARTFLLTPG